MELGATQWEWDYLGLFEFCRNEEAINLLAQRVLQEGNGVFFTIGLGQLCTYRAKSDTHRIYTHLEPWGTVTVIFVRPWSVTSCVVVH